MGEGAGGQGPGVRGCKSEQGFEFIDGESGFSNDGSQSSFGELVVVRNGKTTKWFDRLTEDDVAAALVIKFITDLPQRADNFSARDDWQPAQSATSTNSSEMEGGIGSSCFRKLAR